MTSQSHTTLSTRTGDDMKVKMTSRKVGFRWNEKNVKDFIDGFRVLAIYGSCTIDSYVTKHYYIETVDADNQYPKHLLLVDRAPSKRIRFIQFR